MTMGQFKQIDIDINSMLKRDAAAIVGGLSKPGKMPCKSIGIPAKHCNVGSKLASVPGSVCSNCYACKGMYRFKTTQVAQQKRYDAIQSDLWIPAMVKLIRDDEYFRFHDSGDIINQAHFDKILQVIELCPTTQFWIPTKEKKLVLNNLDRIRTLDNLIVRVSAPMVNGDSPILPAGIYASTVYNNGRPHGFACRAQWQDGQCKNCRACWSKKYHTVSYPEH